MITLRQHIQLMESISKGISTVDYMSTLKPLDKIDFIRSSEKTYPIKDNVKRPSNGKKIYTSIEDLVLGQFIMLEQIITGKTKLSDHLVDLEIAKLIIRPSHHEVFDNEDPSEEKRNEQDILNMDVLEVYWVLDTFIERRNKTLFNDFSGVFYDAAEEGDEEEDTPEEAKTSEMLFNQQWYWYSMVRMLAQEDITRYSDIYMLPMRVVLPEMSFLAQRNKIESAKERQQQALRKL